MHGKNELKILTKGVSCECKCKFDQRQCNSDQRWNNNINVSGKISYMWKSLYLESHYM